jgi:MSHA pilin protein MshD
MRAPFKFIRQAGFTLLEIITTVVVIAIAATSLMSVFSSTIQTSADPMFEQQAIAIAEAYMEEIVLQDFAVGPGNTRPTYDDVLDYNSLPDSVVRDQNGLPVGGLGDYGITVTVAQSALNGIIATESYRIDIVVTHASIDDVFLSSYRVNY